MSPNAQHPHHAPRGARAWRRRWPALACALAGLLAQGASRADEAPRVPLLPAYQQECGACHVAFPAALLPAASWQRLMNGLPRHYGSDASLAPALQAEIGAWLATHAGTGKRAREAPPEDRITRGAWFQREHRQVAAATWQRPAIQRASHCAACHPQAEKGDFNEHQIRIPR
ncbi:MAG: cytochrome C [Burkholderiales bacterium]|nr:cytochrome C [Burkholderiales bacterium]